MTLANTSNKRNFDLWYVWNGPIFKWGSPLFFGHIFLNIAWIFTKFEMYAQKWLLLLFKASLVQQLDSTPIYNKWRTGSHVLFIFGKPLFPTEGRGDRRLPVNHCHDRGALSMILLLYSIDVSKLSIIHCYKCITCVFPFIKLIMTGFDTSLYHIWIWHRVRKWALEVSMELFLHGCETLPTNAKQNRSTEGCSKFKFQKHAKFRRKWS